MNKRLSVGDVLFYQSEKGDWNPEMVIVERVGRKWAKLVDGVSDTRVDIETLKLDGRYAWGRLWRSEEEWRTTTEAQRIERENDQAWEAFRLLVRENYRRPTCAVVATIVKVSKLLGLDSDRI